MTTENTINELPPLTPEAVAEEFIKANTTSVIIEEFVNHYNTIESLQRKLTNAEQEARNQRSRWASMAETIEEFLKEHIKDQQVSIDDLKELADELEIELTKEVEVTFTVEVTATVTVPIDFNAEDIEESDFDIRINYEGSHNDVECDDIEWTMNDYTSDDK
jgi:sugar-specific transcriptional regulator TrmB